MTEQEKLDLFIETMKETNQLSESQEVQLRMFLKNKPLESIAPKVILQKHYGTVTMHQYVDERISQLKHTL